MHTEDFKQGSVGASRCYVKKLPVGDGCGARFRGLGWPSWAAVVWTRVSVIPGTWQTLACSELYRGENRGEEVCSLGTCPLGKKVPVEKELPGRGNTGASWRRVTLTPAVRGAGDRGQLEGKCVCACAVLRMK